MNQRPVGLQEWYLRVNRTYLFKNYHRTVEAIHTHFVEVVGGLSLIASGKRKPGVVPEKYLPKALAWWFALCGKVGIRNVEDMIWAKFPYVCPYCLEKPHHDGKCKSVGRAAQLDWERLKAVGAKDRGLKPTTLGDWQKMFYEIYPKTERNRHENFSRLAEEIGELSEAVRTLAVTPVYFVAEATDAFAWLMGMINQYEFDNAHQNNKDLDAAGLGKWIQDALWAEYPGRCGECATSVCTCPPVLTSTLGRIAREIPRGILPTPEGPLLSLEEALDVFNFGDPEIRLGDERYVVDADLLQHLKAGADASKAALERLAGTEGLAVQAATAIGLMQEQLARQQITQEVVEAVRDRLDQLPGPAKQFVLSTLASAIPQAVALFFQRQ